MNDKKPTQYYWCVNCGHHGDFGRVRYRMLECENCGYEDLAEYTKEEIQEDDKLTIERFKKKNG